MDVDIPMDVLTGEFEQDINPYGSSQQDIEELLKSHHYLEDSIYDQYLENDTLKYEQCLTRYLNESLLFAEKYPEGFCGATFDSVSCWPPTPLNETVVISCFSEFRGVLYDNSYNASKRCLDNGNWSQSAYLCPPIVEQESSEQILTTTTIYFIGYILSLLALSVAIAIFIYFKDLRCLRNRIHTNLMCAYMCVDFTWIITLVVELNFKSDRPCIVFMILLHYFHLTTFFWMFVEGLYLYILVVKTLTRENFKLRVYACIGWGTPSLFIVVWAVVKSFIQTMDSTQEEMSLAILSTHCPWLNTHLVDWIHKVPVIIVLVLNVFFLASIMWVLITKLRSANTVETQQYRKAAKALLVLMPLLGVTYVLMITTPSGEEYIINMFYYGRAVLLSTQGLTVSLFYCFLNTEVQNTLKHHLETWKTSRSLGQRRLRSESRSKDWSPRSRTESIRNTEWTLVPVEDFVNESGTRLENGQRKVELYSQPAYKRESCTSEVTTTTMVTVNSGHGGPHPRSPFLQPPKPNYVGNV